MADGYYLGRRISYDGHLCTVRFIGQVENTQGSWLGIEWDDPRRGKHNGSYNGVKYFECLSHSLTAGSFVRPNRPHDNARSFLDALREKYGPDESPALSPHGATTAKESTDPIVISNKVVEEIGFDKIRRQLADFASLRIVILDGFCIRCPESINEKIPLENSSELLDDIRSTCPRVTELDLSRNLFEEWAEIEDVCQQLPNLKDIRIAGNRLRSFRGLDRQPLDNFPCVISLNIDDTLVSWQQTLKIVSKIPKLKTLSSNGNQLSSLGESLALVPSTLTSISLERNAFSTLSALSSLASLPHLNTLLLKSNDISSITHPQHPLPTFPNIVHLDLSSNSIDSWSFISHLPTSFPSLASLRVSSNPLYTNLKSSDGSLLSKDHGYILTIARIGALKKLNFSTITVKERLNGETYYLGEIAAELSRETRPRSDESVLAEHPRWLELCKEYGRPDTAAARKSAAAPQSLAEDVVRCRFILADETILRKSDRPRVVVRELPKSMTLYSVQGLVGRMFALPAMLLQLVWLTEEQGDSRSYVSQDKHTIANGLESRPHSYKEEVLLPRPRSLDTWLEGETREAAFRVEWSALEMQRAKTGLQAWEMASDMSLNQRLDVKRA